MKRAPAPLWEPLRALLAGLPIGGSGTLRMEVEPSLPDVPRPEGDWKFTRYRGQTRWSFWHYQERLPSIVTTKRTPPLRPGRYWVPERWEPVLSFTAGFLYVHYVDGGDKFVRHPKGWWPPPQFGLLSPWHMPRWAARLACEVGEERVEEWCSECLATGWVYDTEKCCNDTACEFCGGDGSYQYIVGECPTCLGSPGPWWVYEVTRVEVER